MKEVTIFTTKTCPYCYKAKRLLKKLNIFRKTHTKKLSKLIKTISLKKKSIYGIGASPRGCVLLNSCKLSKYDIHNVGEVPGSDKINKLIPGTNIPICSENKILFFIGPRLKGKECLL